MLKPVTLACCAALAGLTARTGSQAAIQDRDAMPEPARQMVEIRAYNLTPGTREEFHRLVLETLPMLRRWEVDVVAYGPSPHDERSYFLVRAFPSLEARERAEEAFYGSAEWRNGPREQILALIESYTTIVLELDRPTVDALRDLTPR